MGTPRLELYAKRFEQLEKLRYWPSVGHVVRADLARFLLECVTSGAYVGQAVVVGS